MAQRDDAISLYFKLKSGRKADLEVVAAAAIEWVEILRASARVIEPDAQIKVEFVDAQGSSLRLNAILDWAEGQLERIEAGSGKHRRLRKLAIALAIFVIVEGPGVYQTHFANPPVLSLSEDDRRRIDEVIKLLQGAPDVTAPRQKFFRTLERDPSISGVGVSEGRHDPPLILVSSAEFARRGGLFAIEDDKPDRTIRPVQEVILVGPKLVSRPRSWLFQIEGLPEFSATMNDKRFLKALEQNHVRESLRTGIAMTVRLEIKQKKVGGDWVTKPGGRSVIEVLSPTFG